jgi:hypothetical protein
MSEVLLIYLVKYREVRNGLGIATYHALTCLDQLQTKEPARKRVRKAPTTKKQPTTAGAVEPSNTDEAFNAEFGNGYDDDEEEDMLDDDDDDEEASRS